MYSVQEVDHSMFAVRQWYDASPSRVSRQQRRALSSEVRVVEAV